MSWKESQRIKKDKSLKISFPFAGNVQACRILLSFGADPTIVSLQGYTAAQLADEPVAKLLAEEPSSPSGADVEYQVIYYLKSNHSEISSFPLLFFSFWRLPRLATWSW